MNICMQPRNRLNLAILAAFAGTLSAAGPASAQTAAQTAEEEILVIGTPIASGLGQPLETTPYNVQSASALDFEAAQSLDLADYMNANMASVTLNAAQNNPLQNDVQYRGFTASPLLGLAQGIAVYQDGARINEPLGDAVNWDLLPESAISSMSLISGANPVFGLNTLGGALAIQMKNGFNFMGHQAEAYTGSWDRQVATLESGGNNGTWGYYGNLSHFDESGWRDLSDSDALNFYGALSWRDAARSAINLTVQLAESELTGNGAAPVGLLALDRAAIFTAPDITENDLNMFAVNGSHFINDSMQFSGSAYRRNNRTDSFNGDGSEFEACSFSGGNVALFEEADDVEDALANQLGIDLDDICDGGMASVTNYETLEAYIEEQALLAGLDPENFELEDVAGELTGTGIISDEAINNMSDRRQLSKGYDGQLIFLDGLGQHANRLTVGFSYFSGDSRFNSRTELARLDPVTRSTAGLGVGSFVEEAETSIDTNTTTWSVYFTDTLELTDALALTLSGRFNETDITLRDRSGERPELNGDHTFRRLNPAAGLTWQMSDLTTVYASYNESNRVPTPIELSCNEEIFDLARQYAIADGEDPDDIEFECRLPNAFLADPPLDDVVTRNFETGLRGDWRNIRYSAAIFHATNTDDILFQTTGRATGLFANVDKTRRKGFESSLKGTTGAIDWFAAYSFIEATFEDDFTVLSPNHDFADADGEIDVSRGDQIPGIPQHQLKTSAEWHINDRMSVGVDAMYNGSQHLRGDESNQLSQIGGYSLVNLRAQWQVSESLNLFARVSNVFDREYENFGLLGEEPDEIIDFLQDSRARFLGAGAPRGAWLGARLRF